MADSFNSLFHFLDSVQWSSSFSNLCNTRPPKSLLTKLDTAVYRLWIYNNPWKLYLGNMDVWKQVAHVVSTVNKVVFIYFCSLHLVLYLGQEHSNWWLDHGNNQWWPAYPSNHGSQPGHYVLLSNSSTKCQRSGASLGSHPLPDSERFESFPVISFSFFLFSYRVVIE